MIRICLATGLLLAALLVAGGCGIDEEDANAGDAEVTTGSETAAQNEQEPELPPRPAGELALEGSIDSSLTPMALRGFAEESRASGLAIEVTGGETDDATAFDDLCAGTIDVVDSARRITASELEACTDNGLEVIDFRTGFEAVVVATRNERDVGADCVTVEQLQGAFGADSAVGSWVEISPNFLPVRFAADGRGPGATEFDTFQLLVLGIADPTLAAMRPDYHEFEQEEQVRTAVAARPPGAAGIFRFTYYQQFEEQLRPLEVDSGNGAGCIFPSPETITADIYPLSRSFHLFTTDRSLDRVEVQQFLRSYLDQAPQLAEDAELIPVPATLEAIQDERISNPGATQ